MAPPMGRLGHEFSSTEISARMERKSIPPLLGALLVTGTALAAVYGSVAFYDGRLAESMVFFSAAALGLVVLVVVWARGRE